MWRSFVLIVAFFAGTVARADDPMHNPVAAFYSGAEGYPAWTDAIRWSRVINMKTYANGKTAFEKFENARDALREGGGVLYYPAGTYDFTTMPPGRGLMLCHDVVIRGEAPASSEPARNGKLYLPTKFVFPFRSRGGGKVPADWNFVGLQIENGKSLRNSTDKVGIVWVHLAGASIFFGPELDWSKTWGTSGSSLSNKVKSSWRGRRPDGTHPFDALAGGGSKYLGAGKGRLVFGCIVEDAPPLDDFLDPGYGPDGFSTQRYGARIAVYGSRVFVANNLLPRSRKNFVYRQKTTLGKKPVLYDYGKTCGIDLNKSLLLPARDDGTCSGYFEDGIVVRDNHVFNHGHTGFNISGNWVTISGNNNDRAFLRQGDRIYNVAPWILTLDGFQVANSVADNHSRAFDLAGRNLWVDANQFTNTGSSPGKDGEGIVCRGEEGTPIFSWAITHNIHKRGLGSAGLIGGLGVDCRGLLIGWNQTSGAIGNVTGEFGIKMTDCAFVANKCLRTAPDAKAALALGVPVPVIGRPLSKLAPPQNVAAFEYQGDAVKIVWSAAPKMGIGFRVERQIAGGNWHAISYRPPRLQGDPENSQEWVDFTAPAGKELKYRVVALDLNDDDKGASLPTGALMLTK